MRITCPDFICCGDYTISDLKKYFQNMKVKSEREKEVLRVLNDSSNRIDKLNIEICKSYDSLLSSIDEKQHPDLYRVISKALNSFKKI